MCNLQKFTRTTDFTLLPLILQFRQHINCSETFRQQYKLYLPPIHCKIEVDQVQLLPVKTAKTCTNQNKEYTPNQSKEYITYVKWGKIYAPWF